MKSIIIIGDGMSDRPLEALGGKTPLQAARTPHFDRIAARGRMGLFRTIPKGQSLGSAVANLSVLGYDPAKTFRGRAVLEAASMGVALEPEDVALRCNLIALDGDRIKNHSAGHITSEEAAKIIATLDEELGGERAERPVRFYPGISYRHLLVLKGAWAFPEVQCAPPHDHVGEPTAGLLPKALADSAEPAAARLVDLYEKALPLLASHPVNLARRSAGKDEAAAIWPWSPGRKPEMQTFQERFGVRGAVISAVDLVIGLGCYAGMKPIHVEGATGLEDTNYEGKAQACLDALDEYDMVYVHVEATDEAGHAKDLDLKIRCIEYLDQRLVRLVLDGVEAKGIDANIALLPDHPTPVETGSHSDEPVPVAVTGPGIEPDAVQAYDEDGAAKGSLGLLEGDRFIRLVLGREA
ncbi:MAG: cofactor-independent phosphoglycerate mutase [Planctomycetota bacterium]|jgi:2,3-bisphosphoglycerate-independent phosphoglycerate mutase